MTTTDYISQRQAKHLLKKTGRTLAEIKAMVAAMPTKRVGSRDKVHITHVNRILAEHAQPPSEQKPRTIKPLSTNHKRTLRVAAEVGLASMR